MYCIMSTSVYSSIILMINTNITDFEKNRLFVKSGGGKSSITLRDSKLNKLFKVVGV